jgi:methylamine utilization protein MauE
MMTSCDPSINRRSSARRRPVASAASTHPEGDCRGDVSLRYPVRMIDEARPARPLATWLVRLAGLWVLAGGLFKLFLGTPDDLPKIMRDLPLDVGLTFKLAISVELAIGSLALLRPRWAWPAVTALFFVFGGVLASQLASGARSCGCFGSHVPMPPWLMLVIDGSLLVGMLATRPWANAGSGLHPISFAIAALVAAVLPWALDRERTTPPQPGQAVAQNDYVPLDVAQMIGKNVADTKVGQYMVDDVSALPPDGIWILWRADCEHCAAHLEKLKEHPPDTPSLVLVRIPDPNDSPANQKVFLKPSGGNVIDVSLRSDVRYSFITTPGELVVKDGVVQTARDGIEP